MAPVQCINPAPSVVCAAVRSKVVVLLSLIYCLMYSLLFVGVMCLSLFGYALLCVHSSFAISLKRRESWLPCYFVLQMYCLYKCYVALPRGAMGWFEVCDCDIS